MWLNDRRDVICSCVSVSESWFKQRFSSDVGGIKSRLIDPSRKIKNSLNFKMLVSCVLTCIQILKKPFHASVSTAWSWKYLWCIGVDNRRHNKRDRRHIRSHDSFETPPCWTFLERDAAVWLWHPDSCPRLKSAIGDIKRVNKRDLPRRGSWHDSAVWATLWCVYVESSS